MVYVQPAVLEGARSKPLYLNNIHNTQINRINGTLRLYEK